jgi:hypothetical protein
MHPPVPAPPLHGLSSIAIFDGHAQSIAAFTNGRGPSSGSSHGSTITLDPLAEIRASFVAMLQAAGLGRGIITASPIAPSVPVPESPDGALGAAGGSSTGLSLAGFAALLLLAAWAVPRLARRLVAASALWRPVPFISLLERPG